MWTWFLVALAALARAYDIDTESWENVHYYRNVELAKPYVVEYALVEAKNTLDTPQDNYFFHVNDGVDGVPPLLGFTASLMEPRIELQPFKLTDKVYLLKFPFPVAPGNLVEFRVRYVYANAVLPFPEKILLAEPQKLLLRLNRFAYSAYKTLEYSLAFTGLTKGQEMALDLKGVERTPDLPSLEGRVEEQALAYGPLFETLPSLSVDPMGLLFDHNRPLARAYTLERSVWMPASDIGVVQSEEYYELTNAGAELKEGFSRVDWLKGRYETLRNHFALTRLEFAESPDMPFSDYYVTDKVGMVTTHQRQGDAVVVQPRFPLFGGWRYNFTLGWNNKISTMVRKVDGEADTYIARVPLLNTAKDIYYDRVNLHVYLPENAEFLNFSSPLMPASVDVGAEASYLDVAKGHVKVTASFDNLYDDLSGVGVYVTYRFLAANYYAKVARIASFVFAGLVAYYFLGLVLQL